MQTLYTVKTKETNGAVKIINHFIGYDKEKAYEKYHNILLQEMLEFIDGKHCAEVTINANGMPFDGMGEGYSALDFPAIERQSNE